MNRGPDKKSKNQPHACNRFDLRKVKKCGAKTRSGGLCGQPAMSNGRCRLHGGKSTGAPKGNQNALKHGAYTAEMKAFRKLNKQLIQEWKDLKSAFG